MTSMGVLSRLRRWVPVAVLLVTAACGQAMPPEEGWTGVFTQDPDPPAVEEPDGAPPMPPGPPWDPPETVPTTPPPPLPQGENAAVSTRAGREGGTAIEGCDVRLTEFHLSGGTPSGVVGADDGSAWFTDPHDGSIGHLSADGTVRRHRLAPGSTPAAITRGPDGNHWFIDPKLPRLEDAVNGAGPTGGPEVGRITRSGLVTTFPFPTTEQNPMGGPGVGSLPWDIVAGPDGALWVTQAGADQLARVDLDGRITEIPVPSRAVMHAHLGAIVVGPDGALYFQQTLRNSIGRHDPGTGAFSEWMKRDGQGGVSGGSHLAVGADGALWFEGAGHGVPGLSRMSLDGQIRRFPLANDADYRPGALTAGPGGGIWFLDTGGRGPMHMTFDGRFTRVGVEDLEGWVSRMARPHMTTGPDGTVWYSQPERHRLGRITCAGLEP